MTDRHLLWATVSAAATTVTGYVVGYFEPAYYSPETVFDYFGSVVNDLSLAVTGVALIIWSRVTPVRRAWLPILGAGIGALIWTVGNVLEEIMELDFGEVVYFVGSISAFALTAAAGFATLTYPSRWRWSGLALFGISAGFGIEAVPFLPVAWTAMALAMWRGWFIGSVSQPV